MIDSPRLEQLRRLGFDVDEHHDDVAGVHVAAVRGFGVATMLNLTDDDVDVAIASLTDLKTHTERVRQHVEGDDE